MLLVLDTCDTHPAATVEVKTAGGRLASAWPP
jgi:hypothetical protein